jgi:hypothetical protein
MSKLLSTVRPYYQDYLVTYWLTTNFFLRNVTRQLVAVASESEHTFLFLLWQNVRTKLVQTYNCWGLIHTTIRATHQAELTMLITR